MPISVGKQLKHLRPTTRALVVAVDPAEDQLIEALHLELQGLVVDPLGVGEVAQCVRRVRHGQLALDQRYFCLSFGTVARLLRGLQQVSQVLTARELEIVALVGSGCTAKDIARRLFCLRGDDKSPPARRLFEAARQDQRSTRPVRARARIGRRALT